MLIAKQLSFRRIALAFAGLAILVLLVGRFWWFDSGSAWASVIRGCLLIALVAGAVAWLKEQNEIKPSPLLGVVFVFLLYLSANSLLVAEDMQMLRRLLVIMALLVVVCIIGKREAFWFQLLAVSVVAGAGYALVSLVHNYVIGNLPLGYREARLSGTGFAGVAEFGNTIVAGLNYGFCLIAAAWLFFVTRSKGVRVLWLFCLMTLAIYLYFTFARTSWVAAMIGVALVAWLMLPARERWFLIGATAIVAAIVGVLGYDALAYEFGTRGVTYRDEIWEAVISRMDGHWWFGHGIGAPLAGISIAGGLNIVHNTHNLYLEVLYQTGLVGLSLLMAMMAGIVWRLLRSDERLAVLWLAVFVAMAAVMLVELRSFIGSPNLVWIWFWLPLGGALALGRRDANDIT